MFITVVSDNAPNDVMSAWNFQLQIAAITGTGSLTFQDPVTGTPSNPANYVFGSNGLGILATNGGTTLSANDFFNPAAGPGAAVPGTPGANLLQMDFLASPTASALFGIYAVEGAANTQWTDSNATTRFFTNVPDGTDMVEIGEVMVVPNAVPEPSTFWVFGLGGVAFAGWEWWRKR